MIAYVDSSVFLRFVFQQPDPLLEIRGFNQRITSLITEVECMCAIDAAHARQALDANESMERRVVAHAQLKRTQRVLPSPSIIRRAGQSLPVPLRSLDAIHVATALLWRERYAPDLVFATHDRQQARAAAALGFDVLGV